MLGAKGGGGQTFDWGRQENGIAVILVHNPKSNRGANRGGGVHGMNGGP